MDLKHLRTFAVAAEHHSFTRAASQLEITQAAVSQHVAALERNLGVNLFERAHRRVELTAAGAQLLEYSRRILGLVDEATAVIQGVTQEVEGTVRIAASSVPSEWLVPELLSRFRERYPRVRESLSVSDSGAACHAVLEGDADVAFIGELPTSKWLNARPIANDEIQLVVAANHRWSKQRQISLRKLSELPILMREPESATRHCVERVLADHGVRVSDLQVALQVNSNDAIRAAIERGVGAAFLSTRSVKADVAAGRFALLRISGTKFERQLYLITRKDQVPASPLREFLDVAVAQSVG
jgi:DNA-binding transcriptional LysR family regulator